MSPGLLFTEEGEFPRTRDVVHAAVPVDGSTILITSSIVGLSGRSPPCEPRAAQRLSCGTVSDITRTGMLCSEVPKRKHTYYPNKCVAVCAQCAFISDSNLFRRKMSTLHWVRKCFIFYFFDIMSSTISNSILTF